MKFLPRFSVILFFIVALIACSETPKLAQEERSTSIKETNDSLIFKSILEEPLRKSEYYNNVYFDFDQPYAFQMDSIKEGVFKEVRVAEIRPHKNVLPFLSVLPELTNLEALSIVNASLSTELLDSLFKMLARKEHFKKIMLYSCEIKKLPASIGLLKGLQTLDLSRNQLKKLPKELGKLKELTYLRVYNNRSFQGFPNEIGALTNLILLDFAGTSVDSLPTSIAHCTDLRNITGNACGFKKLPESIENCFNLKYINLSYNKIKSLPYDFGRLENLVHLQLSNNLLEELPSSFSELKALEWCYLDNNRFSSFPTEMKKMDWLGVYTVEVNGELFQRPIPKKGTK